MRTRLTLLAAIAAALAAPAAASAGGWATVEFDPPPDDLAPGEPWRVQLEILQHGVTPLEGVKPRVIVTQRGGGAEKTFPARATAKPGVYRATVVFDSEGTWRYRVDDGFTAVHDFPPVRIGAGAKQAAVRPAALRPAALPAPSDSGDDGPGYLLAILAGAAAALAAGLGAAAIHRRSEPR